MDPLTLIIITGGVLIGVFYVLFIYIPTKVFYSEFCETPSPLGGTEGAPKNIPENDHFSLTTLQFKSNNIRCEGDLYLPYPINKNKKYPCIFWAHGFTGTRDMELWRYSRKMYKINNKNNNNFKFAMFIFDYRNFGTSDGNNRHFVSPNLQCQDYINAIKYIIEYGNEYINKNNIILMGHSFSGGHVLNICGNPIFKKLINNNFQISCILSSMPFLGNNKELIKLSNNSKWEEFTKRGIKKSFIFIYGMISDIIRYNFGYKNGLYSLIWASKYDDLKDFGFSIIEESHESELKYWAKHPKVRKGDWRNALSLRSILLLTKYHPINFLKNIEEPVLYIIAYQDHLCTPVKIKYAASITKNCQVFGIDMKHHDWYLEKNSQICIEQQLKFLKKYIKD